MLPLVTKLDGIIKVTFDKVLLSIRAEVRCFATEHGVMIVESLSTLNVMPE